MEHIVKIKKTKKIKDVFEWCSKNCSRNYGHDGKWGSSWWTIGQEEFHFKEENDAILFALTWA